MRLAKNKICKISLAILFVIGLESCREMIPQSIPDNDPVIKEIGDGNQIDLLTFNIQAIFGKDEDKLDGLTDYIKRGNFDFVVLQELFDEDARKYLMDSIDSSNYQSIIPQVEYSSFPEMLFEDAGLFLKSKYKQVDLSNIDFGRSVEHSYGAIHKILTKELSVTTDFLANKSIMGSLHKINDSSFVFLFTTHLQAIGSKFQRRTQLRQIRRFIENGVYHILKNEIVPAPEKLTVLLAGDFNVNAYSDNDSELLKKFLGNPRDLHLEFSPEKPEFTMNLPLFNFQVRFDFIFAYDEIGPVTLNKVKVKSINVTNVIGHHEGRISDHYALKASLLIN